MEIARREADGVSISVEEQLVLQLQRARQLLSEARTLDEAQRVEGFLKATLEWAKRREEICLSARNDATHLWLEAKAKQGEMLGEMERQSDGRPGNRSLSERFSDPLPTLRSLGYARPEALRLQQIASVPRDLRSQLAAAATEQGERLTQKALLDAARQAAQREHAAAAGGSPAAAGECPPTLPQEYHNAVVIGDARELAAGLADSSIAICFCDPVYDRLADYEWLAKECERVLLPGGSLIVQCGNTRRFECEVAMRRSGLEFVDLLAEVYPYGIGRLFKPKVFVGWKPYLWFSRGPRSSGWVMNRLAVGGKTHAADSKDIHPWGDSEQFAAGILGKLCQPGDCVWDPFTGSATVPVVAAKMGLPFVAFEIDPETAVQAQQRIAGTRFECSPQQTIEFEGDDE